MSDCLDEAQLSRFCDGEMTAEAEASVNRHIADCERCKRLVDERHARIESLCDALQDNTVPLDEPEERHPQSIGPYKILEPLGEGGFGLVFLADQTAPVRRRVAVKLIKPGMDSRAVIARFEAERQALAMMNHPNVARVYDAGTTDDSQGNRPYFVMEHVPGVPITEHCDRQKLTVDERLALFLQTCEAIQHAHQKGIIHRDIKPSNILVGSRDGKAAVKVIDFGVAKAIQQKLTDKTVFTEQGQMIGTPAYMSPEQAEMTAEDIDTRSDIYSLGVLLYEMLTGELPFDSTKLREVALREIQRIIREEEPSRPSTRLQSRSTDDDSAIAARNRRSDPTALTRRIRGDLDWIVMKALEKDRTRRYVNASDFAADIERHLKNEPVLAGPPSVHYRVSKFVRRNRAAVTGVCAVALSLVLGIILATTLLLRAWEAEELAEKRSGQLQIERDRAIKAEKLAEGRRKEADEQRAEAQYQAETADEINRFLNVDLLGAVRPENAKGRDISVREVLDEASRRIEGKFPDKPEVAAGVHETLGRMYQNLSEYEQAEEHLSASYELYRKAAGDDHPATLSAANNLAWLYMYQNKLDRAEELIVTTLETRRRVLGKDHPDTLHSLNSLAALYENQAKFHESETLHRQVLSTRRRVLGNEDPGTLSSMANLGQTLWALGKHGEAESLDLERLAIQRKSLGDDHPDTLITLNSLASIYNNQGRYKEALPLYVEALQAQVRILGESHRDTLATMNNLAALHMRRGHPEKAEPLLAKAYELQRQVLGDDHPTTLTFLNNLAAVCFRLGKLERARALQEKALSQLQVILGERHPTTLSSMNNLAMLNDKLGRHEEAESMFVKVLELREQALGPEHPETLQSMGTLATFYGERKRYEDAEKLLIRALSLKKEVLGEQHPETLETMYNMATLYQALDRHQESEEMFIRTLELARSELGDKHPTTLTSQSSLGYLYFVLKQYAKAEPLLAAAVSQARESLPEGHYVTAEFLRRHGQCLVAMEKFEPAEAVLLESHKHFEAKFGPDHKETVASTRSIIRLYEKWNKPAALSDWKNRIDP